MKNKFKYLRETYGFTLPWVIIIFALICLIIFIPFSNNPILVHLEYEYANFVINNPKSFLIGHYIMMAIVLVYSIYEIINIK